MKKLVIWIAISMVLFLCPGPSFWYGLSINETFNPEGLVYSMLTKIQIVMTQIEQNHEVKQLGSHFILMALCAFHVGQVILTKFVSSHFYLSKFLFISIIFIFVLSFIIEFLQSILRSSFARGFAWIDIIISLFGGFVGILVFLFWNRNKELI